jgi:hypothetical protein
MPHAAAGLNHGGHPDDRGRRRTGISARGGWNACPAPEYHVAALPSWHERYGAELVAIGGDVIELRVSRRPAGRIEALTLAREMYLYDEDIVSQGTETFAMLAATLMASDWWFFRWD